MRKLRIDDKVKNISTYDYYKFYLRNSRVCGVAWLLLTICLTICLIIVFLSPEWAGDSLASATRGYFGLYEYCVRSSVVASASFVCNGRWTDFSTLPDRPAIKAACVLVGLSCLLCLLCILVALFSVFIKFERVFHVCAWIQLFAFLCLFIGICVFPIGWDASQVRDICGEEADQLSLGTCSVRWPYILAGMAALQLFLLTILAFLLAARQAKYILKYGSTYDSMDNELRFVSRI